MVSPPDLSGLVPGDRVQARLVVLDVESRGGASPYTVLLLGNSTGRIPSAPFWAEQQPLIAGVTRRAVVQVRGEVQCFKDRRQLRVTSLRVLPPGTVEPGCLLPSVGAVGPYWEVLDRHRAEVRGPRLQAVVALFFEDPDFRRPFGECPASLSGHHAQLGGLLKHTAEVATLGRAIGRAAGADPDVVLAGALLHDIGKLEAYRWEGTFEGTEVGTLVGHVVLGALRLERTVRARTPLPCTDDELALLHHLLLSHHGRAEHGAPVPPMTLEAEVLHHADLASAKTTSLARALADSANFREGERVSARGVWQLDGRRVFRGASDWGENENGRTALGCHGRSLHEPD